jgi:Amidase
MFDTLTPPLKEYTATDTNVFTVSEPGTFADLLTERSCELPGLCWTAVRACEVSLNSAASTQKHKLPCDLHYAVTVAVVVDHWPGKAAFKKGDDMGVFADFDRYDGLGLARLVRMGEVRSSELVEEAISRIETRSPQINTIVFKTFESARAAAAAPSAGPFAGVPFLLKDMSASLAGAPMSCGNRVLAKIGMDHDDEIVRRYKGAGLIILGKTNVPEFGLAPVTESVKAGAIIPH